MLMAFKPSPATLRSSSKSFKFAAHYFELTSWVILRSSVPVVSTNAAHHAAQSHKNLVRKQKSASSLPGIDALLEKVFLLPSIHFFTAITFPNLFFVALVLLVNTLGVNFYQFSASSGLRCVCFPR
jgi:hypothetical protein